MKFKGKIAPWYWAILVIVNGMSVYFNAIGEGRAQEILIYVLIADFVLLPPVFRNYVLLEKGEVTVAFGFGKDTVKTREILEVYPSRNPLAASAASLDRIVIKTKNSEIMCAVKKKEEFLAELKKRNKRIKFQENAKKTQKTKKEGK